MSSRLRRSYMYIDVSYLMEISENDPVMINELAALYKSQVPELVYDMEKALEENNISQFKKIIHKSKSASLVMGIQSIIDKLQVLEERNYTIADIAELNAFVNYFSELSYLAIQEIDLFLNKLS